MKAPQVFALENNVYCNFDPTYPRSIHTNTVIDEGAIYASRERDYAKFPRPTKTHVELPTGCLVVTYSRFSQSKRAFYRRPVPSISGVFSRHHLERVLQAVLHSAGDLLDTEILREDAELG